MNKKLFKLTDHVYILPYDENTDRPNIGYIINGNKAIIFDAGCGPKTVNFLRSELEKNNLPLPEEIIVSHFHWDHTFALGYIDGKTYGSEYTDKKLNEIKNMNLNSLDDLIDNDNLMPDFCKEHIHIEYDNVNQIKLRGIDDIVNDSKIINLNGLEIEIRKIISPHSEGQLLAYIKQDRVLFIGDSFSGLIYGFDFIDEPVKRKQFNDTIAQFDFKYIVNSHFDVQDKKTYYQMVKDNK